MAERLRVGLVGTGWVAHQHIAGSRQVAGDLVDVVAACDPRREVLDDFCDQYDVGLRFDDAEAMVRSGEIEVLALLTPPSVRDEVIDPALEHGLHLLVEKPYATSGQLAVTYTEAAEAAGVTLAVGQNFRWFPEYQWLSQRLAQDDAGAPTYLEARSFQNRPQAPGQWRAQEHKLEMAIFSVHLIDRLQWLADREPMSVTALTRRGPGSDLPGEQLSSLLVAFADDVVGHVTSTASRRNMLSPSADTAHVIGSAPTRRRTPTTATPAAVARGMSRSTRRSASGGFSSGAQATMPRTTSAALVP